MSTIQDRPKPISQFVVCSVCDQAWDQHLPDETKEVPLFECIRLLKAELARRPRSAKPYLINPKQNPPLKGPYWDNGFKPYVSPIINTTSYQGTNDAVYA